MSQELTTRQAKMKQLLKYSADVVEENVQVLATNGIDKAYFADALRTAILSNPALVEQDPGSVMRCLRRACLDGLLPDGDQAAIITSGQGARYLPMVNGLKAVVEKDLKAEISVEIVRRGDKVKMKSTLGEEDPTASVEHGEEFFTDEERPIVGAICMCRIPGKTAMMIAWKRRDIDMAKSKSATANNPKGPWNTWEAAMVEKAIVKSMINRRLRSLIIAKGMTRLTRMVDLDTQEELEGVTVDVTPEVVSGQLEAPQEAVIEADPVAQPPEPQAQSTRTRGRPKGSKNKPKPAPAQEPEYIEASPASEPTPASEEPGDEMAFQLPPEPPPGDEDDYEREPGSDDDRDGAHATKQGGIAL